MRIILLTCALILTVSQAMAADVSVEFSWTPNSPDDYVTGYKIYHGASPGAYDTVTDVGLPEANDDGFMVGEVTGIPQGVKFYYAATAYNEDGESDYSDEVMYRVPRGKPSKPQWFKWFRWY